MIRKSIRGVIRGRSIELEAESGFAEGEEVEAIVRSLDPKSRPPLHELEQLRNEIDSGTSRTRS
jgi:hypothetical protein